MRASPTAIAWLQRALAHEFAAARQFALQAAVARRAGEEALARFCAAGANEELEHAQRLAAALLALKAGFDSGAAPAYAVGTTPAQIVAAGIATERAAVALYERAVALASDAPLRDVLHGLLAEERDHLQKFERWQTGRSPAPVLESRP